MIMIMGFTTVQVVCKIILEDTCNSKSPSFTMFIHFFSKSTSKKSLQNSTAWWSTWDASWSPSCTGGRASRPELSQGPSSNKIWWWFSCFQNSFQGRNHVAIYKEVELEYNLKNTELLLKKHDNLK